jgi:hypothetical protein
MNKFNSVAINVTEYIENFYGEKLRTINGKN